MEGIDFIESNIQILGKRENVLKQAPSTICKEEDVMLNVAYFLPNK
jgi:hypothetical protein